MKCKKCGRDISAEDALFCPWCGKKQQSAVRSTAKRANGQGSAYKTQAGTWTAAKVWGYEPTDTPGRMKPVKSTKGGFRTKSAALAYIPQLQPPKRGRQPNQIDKDATFFQVFESWLPVYQRRGRKRSTENCYKGAFKYYRPIWHIRFADIGIDDLQECVDECPCGRRTRENMKAAAGLIYKYAIPRGYLPEKLNLAEFLFVGGQPGEPREDFKPDEIEIVRQNVGRVPYADYIYCSIYLGFRPHEFLTLDAANYNREERCFVGGGKTEAGTDRSVTVSPKIQPIIDSLLSNRTSGPVFCGPDGKRINDKKYREECFYPALQAMGLPLHTEGTRGPRKLTPYCCRHTFATLMKAVQAPDKDKLELMGHTSTEMLQHYQHVHYEDLRNITDRI